jgi:septum formation protein
MAPRPKPSLVLASTSPYRAELLRRLGLTFTTAAPRVDETPKPHETAQRLSVRLAEAKAGAVAATHPAAWVLGSDQSASCDGRLLGKPGTRTASAEQLAFMSGREAVFATAISLVCQAAEKHYHALELTTVRLRTLKPAEIERYLDREPALDCAGGFKCEGLGITLFSEIRSNDPSALIGLPLIQTARLLRKAGFVLP